MSTFKIGDLVRLKSSGPQMVVSGLGEHNRDAVECTWWGNTDGDGPKTETFHKDTLVRAPGPADPAPKS